MKNAKLVIVPYYVLSTISLYLAYPLPSMAVGDVPAAIINYLFIFGTIPASNSLSKSYRLGKQNNRLELIARHSERDRIAQQLHDNLGQSFSMLALKAELAEKLLEKDPVLAKQQLKDIAAASRQNLDLVREIVADMKYSTILQTLDIQQSNLDKSGIMLHTKNEEITVDWNKDIQNTISQIITELVTNAIRYSHGNLFSVTFSQNKNLYLITVHDNGIGFDKNISYKKSFGLSGIKKRIDYLDGNVNFDNDNGAKIDISIPIVKGD
ncbi:sensor histidine kinase [Ligilactobacillus salivarius]|nr:histidine kinase [Ligilactobacillus salivarius]